MTDQHRRDFDDVKAELQHAPDKIRAQRDAFDNDLPRLSVEAKSADGAVEVTVDWEGLLTGLRLGPNASHLDPRHLAALVLATYTTAQRDAARKVADIFANITVPKSFFAYRLHQRETFAAEVIPEPAPESDSVSGGMPQPPRSTTQTSHNDLVRKQDPTVDDDADFYEDPDNYLRG